MLFFYPFSMSLSFQTIFDSIKANRLAKSDTKPEPTSPNVTLCLLNALFLLFTISPYFKIHIFATNKPKFLLPPPNPNLAPSSFNPNNLFPSESLFHILSTTLPLWVVYFAFQNFEPLTLFKFSSLLGHLFKVVAFAGGKVIGVFI